MADAKPQRGAWTITLLLFCFMMINFADKAVVGLAGVPIMRDLGLTPREFGLVGSSFFFLFSVTAVIGGFVVNRVSSKWVLFFMALIWSVVQFPMVGNLGLGTLVACRVVLGAGEGPAYPIALHAAYKWFPDEKRAVAGAVIAQGAGVGVIVSVPLLNWIITRYDWHMAFGALGVAGMAWVALWGLIGREGKLDKDEVEVLDVVASSARKLPYRHLLLNATNIGSWCAYFAAYFGLALALSWFTPYLVAGLDMTQQFAGKLTALVLVVGFFVIIASSWLSQRMMQRGASSRAARGIFTGLAIIAGGAALVALSHAEGIAAQVALVVVGTMVPSVAFTLLPTILGEITPPSQRGAVLAINSAVGSSAGIVAPFAMGNVIQRATTAVAGYQHGFVICGIVMLIGGAIGLLLLHPENAKAHYARIRASLAPEPTVL